MDDAVIPHWFCHQWTNCLLRIRYASPLIITAPRAMNRRDHYTFVLVRHGTLVVRTHRYRCDVPPGHAVLLPPLRHADQAPLRPNEAARGAVIGFHVQPLRPAGNPLPRLGLPVVLPVTADDSADAIVHESDQSETRKLQARGWLDEMLLKYLAAGFAARALTATARPAL